MVANNDGASAGRRLAIVLAAAVALAGCASTQTVDQFPSTIETEIAAEPPEPDRIEYIDVRPWSVEPGRSVEVTVRGTAGRRARVDLSGETGEGRGVSQSYALAEGDTGQYRGSISTAGLPPGTYRLEAILEGGPTGEPARLASSRTRTVAAPPPPPPPPDRCEIARGKLAPTGIHFGFDRYDLDEASRAWLRQAAKWIAEAGDRVESVRIVGHCDERGTIEYNLGLGARRAQTVRDALLSLPGMSGLAISTISKGEEEPLVPNARTEEEHAENRRAEIELICRPAN